MHETNQTPTFGEIAAGKLIEATWELPAGQRLDRARVAQIIDSVSVPCGCEKLRELVKDIMYSHTDKDSSDYNACESDPCQWCVLAKEALAQPCQPVSAGSEREPEQVAQELTERINYRFSGIGTEDFAFIKSIILAALRRQSDRTVMQDTESALRRARRQSAPTVEARDKVEQILKDCHMALLGFKPASYVWGDVNEWLVAHGKSEYAKKLKSVSAPKEEQK